MSAAARFPFVVVDVSPDEADLVSSELFDLGAQGVEERDATTLVKGVAGGVTLSASFASFDEAEEAMRELAARQPRLEVVEGDAWRDAWKEHFHPFEVAPGIVIRPPWEAYEGSAKTVLELEPGRAFGTGLHETTSLVANVLVDHAAEVAGQPVLDVGCGSGILAIVAMALGAARARAIDIDADAIEVARANAASNGYESSIACSTETLAELGELFPIVVANIEAQVLVPMAPELMNAVAPGGLLVLSGVLTGQREMVVAAYPGFERLAAPARGEWVAIVLRRPRATADVHP